MHTHTQAKEAAAAETTKTHEKAAGAEVKRKEKEGGAEAVSMVFFCPVSLAKKIMLSVKVSCHVHTYAHKQTVPS